MSSASGTHGQDHSDLVLQCALQALPSSDVRRVEAQISACADCRQEMEALRPIIDSFVSWPIDVLRPSASLWGRLARRIAAETAGAPVVPCYRVGRNRNGKKWRLGSPASCSRPIRRRTA